MNSAPGRHWQGTPVVDSLMKRRTARRSAAFFSPSILSSRLLTMNRLLRVGIVGLSLLAAGIDDASSTAAGSDAQLRSELLQRTEADQAARNAYVRWLGRHGANGVVNASDLGARQRAEMDRLLAAMKTTDATNTAWLRDLVDRRGWPTSALVGNDGAHAAWLLVQHADADPKFQRQCLDLMSRLPRDEVSPADVALLTDRVLLAEGKKQIYGTQFVTVDGALQPRPLEDEANVDQRRAEVGLPPLSEYIRALEKIYGARAKSNSAAASDD